MLSQNFLPADQLGLTEKQRDAMIVFLGMCERGEMKYHTHDAKYYGGVSGDNNVRMDCWFHGPADSKFFCGTVGCIGGWVEHMSGEDLLGRNLRSELADLFLPDNWRSQDFTLDQIACATRNYLIFGQAKWEEIFS